MIEILTASVGGSIGCDGRELVDESSVNVSETLALLNPAMATISPASAELILVRFNPRNASNLVILASSITSPLFVRA